MSFPIYPAYKDCAEELLDQMPVHWQASRLKKYISAIGSGVSVNSVDVPAARDEVGVLKTSCVYDGTFRPSESKIVVADELDRVACPVVKDAIIVSRMNTPALVGAAGLVREDHPNLFLPDRLWQVTLHDCEPAFVHYWMQTPHYRAQVENACSGTSSSMQNLGQDDFRCFIFAVPTLAEQRAIAGFLEHETAKIDALITEQEKMLALLAEKRQATISCAVTRGLDSAAPVRHSGISWLGDVAAGWNVAALGFHLAEKPCYGVLVPDFDPEGIPMLRITDMENGCVDRAELNTISPALAQQYHRTFVQKGDVVLSVVGTIGEVLVVDELLAGVNLSRALARIVPASSVSAEWLCFFFQSQPFREFVNLVCVGTAQRVLNMDDLRSLRIPLPPRMEQEQVAAYLAKRVPQIDRLASSARTSIEILRERRKAVISAAVTGQIDVRNAARMVAA